MAHKGPSIVHEMADKFPLIDLHLTSSMRDKLSDRVLKYKLDAAFIHAPVYNVELKQIHVNDESIVAVTPISIKNLNDLLEHAHMDAIVFDQGCFFRARLKAWLISNNIMNYNKTVINSIEGVVNFIEFGIGFSFLPEEIVSTFYSGRKIKTHALPTEIGVTKNVLIYRKDNLSSPVLNAFISLFS